MISSPVKAEIVNKDSGCGLKISYEFLLDRGAEKELEGQTALKNCEVLYRCVASILALSLLKLYQLYSYMNYKLYSYTSLLKLY